MKKVTYPNPIPNAPRGVKNNNPGNLRKSPSPWKGKIIPSADPDFEQFYRMEDGARASMKNIQTWFGRGKNTIRKLISTWAPPTENKTENYIQFISNAVGIPDDVEFRLTPELLKELAFQISIMENGRTKYITRNVYEKAYAILNA
jgi:hypothetical protein